MFFGCFVCVFLVFGREKNVQRNQAKSKNSKKMCSSLICGVSGAIYSLDMLFKAVVLGGPPALTSFDRVDPDTFGKVLTSCF